MKSDKNDIVEKIKLLANKNPQQVKAINEFNKRYVLAHRLYNFIRDVGGEEEVNGASKNLIVNYASAFEVFCKELILGYRNKWRQEGFSELLKEKISLNDAYSLFKDTPITREDIVANFFSFQNLATVSNVFDNLTGARFFTDVNNSTVYYLEDENSGFRGFGAWFPEWRATLSRLLELRHKIIHEADLTEIINAEELASFTKMLAELPYAFTIACEINFKQRAS